MAVTSAAVELPQGEVARAPGNPLLIPSGAFAGQMLLGDVAVGGIRRIFLEKVGGEWQGAAFFWGNGLEAGVNRLIWGPDGHLYAGLCGQGTGWSYKQDFGLQKLKPNGKAVFEMLAVKARAGGLEIEYTAPANAAAADKAKYTVRSWQYTSTSEYNNPPQGTQTHAVASTQVSPDKRKVFLAIPGLAARKVVHIALSADIAAEAGGAAWTKEAWYTLNALGTTQPFEGGVAIGPGVGSTGTQLLRAAVRSGRLQVDYAGSPEARVTVRTLEGAVLAASTLAEAAAGLPAGTWAPGVYVVEVSDRGRRATCRTALP
jgi:hypothetical protein